MPRLALPLLAVSFALSAPALADLAPKRASDIVHLYSADTACTLLPGPPSGASIGTRILPDATIAPLVVPKGRVLVVREVRAVTTNQVPGTEVFLSVLAGTPNAAAQYATRKITVDSLGQISETFAFPLGVVVPAGAGLCVVDAGGLSMGGTAEGFFAPAK